MRIKALTACFFFCLCLWLSPIACAEPANNDNPYVFKLTEPTIAGMLRAVDLNQGDRIKNPHIRFTLKGKTIREIYDDAEGGLTRFDFDGHLHPSILKHFKKPVAGFDEVIIFEQYDGNSCVFGGLWILGLMRDGSYNISNDINDLCTGPDAIVKVKDNKIVITYPGFKPENGAGYIAPTEVYEYSDGLITEVQ